MDVILGGATGLVGSMMLKVLEESSLPVDRIIPAASERSAGKVVTFKGKPYTCVTLDEALNSGAPVALFSAGGSVSLEWAPRFAAKGITVIDNSSAWRMDPSIKLVVPEINGHLLERSDKIIANPNCSTIQMVMVLNPLRKLYGIRRVVVSTYQSVTGTGQKAVAQMEAERRGEKAEMVYKYPIDLNCIPHCDVFLDNGYTKEEMKLVHETCKILGDESIRVTATAVRVPVVGGHSESVNIEFLNKPDLNEVRNVLSQSNGIILQDDIHNFLYPMPLLAKNRNEVFVGRIRMDDSQPNTMNMWIVADNLRKGAATNAVQIAELLHKKELI